MNKNKKIVLTGLLIASTLAFVGCTGKPKDSIPAINIKPIIETDSSKDINIIEDLELDVKLDVKPDVELDVELDIEPETPEETRLAIDQMVNINIDKDTYSNGDKLKLNINNTSDSYNMTFGRLFEIKKVEENSLIDVPFNIAVTMDMVVLEPNGEFSQEFELTGLEPGDYRLFKSVFIEVFDGIEVSLEQDFKLE